VNEESPSKSSDSSPSTLYSENISKEFDELSDRQNRKRTEPINN
jgi:hypothetical protein